MTSDVKNNPRSKSPTRYEISSRATMPGDVDKAKAVISFHHLWYRAQEGPPCRKKEKIILRDVSGVFTTGLNVILGPSGGGKTSLLDLLAKRRDVSSNDLRGEILLNGKPLPSYFKHIAAYVVQDDVVMGTLTVRENLMFAADMRMPSPRSRKDREAVVDDLIRELGLENCADSKVGTPIIKGVSGGERKRCNIGTELVTRPKVIFLDEPTTGLDSSTSFTAIKILKRLAESGNRTIIFSIHQPRFSIYEMFDRLQIMSCFGQSVYHGPAKDALGYFNSLGLKCEDHNNPTDFYLDLVMDHSDESQKDERGQMSIEGQSEKDHDSEKEHVNEGFERSVDDIDDFIPKKDRINLPQKFRESPENKKLLSDCDEVINNKENLDGSLEGFNKSFGVGFFSQIFYLIVRLLRNFLRNPQASIMPIIVSSVQGLVAGIVWFSVETNSTGFQNFFGAIVFLAINMMFSNLPAIELFINGRAMYLHELANGYYGATPFYLATLLVDLILKQFLPTLCFITIFYWMVGFQEDAGKFFFTFLVGFSLCTATSSIAFLYSVLTGVLAVASALFTVTAILQFLFSGLIVNVASLPAWIRWAEYISMVRYAIKAISVNQLADLNFCGQRVFTFENGTRLFGITCEQGKQLLHERDLPQDDDEKWFNWAMIATMSVVFVTITFVRLYTLKKTK